jgi:hypothetical protein
VSVLVWLLVGIALWHFTVLLPDRFHGGIIGAFLYAVGGAMLTGYALPEPGVPLENPPGYKHVVWPLPGALGALAVSWWMGSRAHSREPEPD